MALRNEYKTQRHNVRRGGQRERSGRWQPRLHAMVRLSLAGRASGLSTQENRGRSKISTIQ
jgi:hypothetical protein